jgi:hypothetical protein
MKRSVFVTVENLGMLGNLIDKNLEQHQIWKQNFGTAFSFVVVPEFLCSSEDSTQFNLKSASIKIKST